MPSPLVSSYWGFMVLPFLSIQTIWPSSSRYRRSKLDFKYALKRKLPMLSGSSSGELPFKRLPNQSFAVSYQPPSRSAEMLSEWTAA